MVGANLDVKRVKYSYKQANSPADDKGQLTPEQEESNKMGKEAAGSRPTPTPFQPSQTGKEAVRSAKGGRRAGPQVERAR